MLRLTTGAPWYVLNSALPQDLRVATVDEVVQHHAASSTPVSVSPEQLLGVTPFGQLPDRPSSPPYTPRRSYVVISPNN